MKVCFFNLNAYSAFNEKSGAPFGGTEIQLYLLARFLASFNQEIEVNFITGDWGQRTWEIFDGVNVYRSVSLKKKFFNYLFAPFLIWRKLGAIDAEVYIASSAGVEIGIVGIFCMLKRRKFIYRVAHDWDCSGEFSKRGFSGRMFRLGLTSAEAVIAQNQFQKNELRQNHNINAVLIRNSWELSIHLLNASKKKYILWVARCEKWKNPEIFLDLAAQHPRYDFVMICPKVNDQYFEEVKNKSLLLSNVTFIEKVKFSDIQRYYSEAMIFVNTSEYEGFPNSFIQACLGGAPILSYKVDPDGIISMNEIGYCAKGSLEQLSSNLGRMLNSEKDRKVMAQNALGYVAKYHDIKKNGKEFKDLIYAVSRK